MARKGSPPRHARYLSIDCSDCPVGAHSEWAALTMTERHMLNAGKTGCKVPAGQVVFREGDACRGVYCVKSGLLSVRMTDSAGNSVFLGRMANPGDILGYRPFLVGEPHWGTAVALMPSVICFINGTTVRRLLDRNPALGQRFLQRASRALRNADEGYFESLSLTARARLAHLLMVLKERFGEDDDDGGFVLNLPFSRRDLAAVVGAQPESLSRLIRDLGADGVAKFSGRKVQVHDIERLHAEFAPEDRH